MQIIKLLTFTLLLCSIVNCDGTSSKEYTLKGGAAFDSASKHEALYPNYNLNPLAADSTGMTSTAVELASRIKLGWNIGNTLEAIGGETRWGNPRVTQDLIRLVKSKGFDAIRIPVSWDQYANQKTAEIDKSWLNRVKDIVQYCVDNDIYVVINIHWDGGWLEENIRPEKQAENNAKQKAYWQQIASHFRDFDEHLLFASANEPNVENVQQMQVLLSYHQTFIDVVRATGGRNAYRTLVVQGPKTDIKKTHELFTQMPIDTAANRLMAEVHYYSPYQFTLLNKDETWGKQFFYWGKDFHSTLDTERNATVEEEDEAERLFSLMKAQFVDKGIPVILGEFCAMRRNAQLSGENLALHLASRAYYHKYITQLANSNGLLPFYWDSGGMDDYASGIFDRKNLAVFDQQTLDALLEGAGK